MYFKIKLPVTNHEGVIMLSTGKKFSRQMLIARISCHLHIFIYITHLTKIPRWKLFTTTPMEKSKSEKSPWVKKTKKNRPKEERKSSILSSKEKNLAKSDKGSWFGQTPTTSSASAEDPELSKTLLVRVLLCLYLHVGGPVFPLV